MSVDMDVNTLAPGVRMTAAEFRQITRDATSVHVDVMMLREISRIVPASMAGVSEWGGTRARGPRLRVRFHWYFDEVRRQFVIPAHGMTSNIALVCAETGLPLSGATLYRMMLRRLRRLLDWQPLPRDASGPIRHHGSPRMRAMRTAIHPAAIAARPEHRDGTDAWAVKAIGELRALPVSEQFGQLARMLRNKFGFDQTLIHARCASDPTRTLLAENHRPAWAETYKSMQLAERDQRLLVRGSATTWSAATWIEEDPLFWVNAIDQGIEHGWLMPSSDDLATFVVSRRSEPVSSEELALVEPNLLALGRFAHALLTDQLSSNACFEHDAGAGLEEAQRTILLHLANGKQRAQISSLTGMSIPSIDRRIKTIKEALHVKTTLEALAKARRMGLLLSPG